MNINNDFAVGIRYSLSDIWDILKVPEVGRTPDWQDTIYDFSGAYYVLCQEFNVRNGTFSECRRHFSEIHCYGKPGVTLQPAMARAIVLERPPVHLFFKRNEQHSYVYLGTGRFRGYYDGQVSPLYVTWAIDNGDNLLPLREHIDALRRVCAFSLNDNMWLQEKVGDNPTLELLSDQLIISSAIEEVQVNTCRFGDGTRCDSGMLKLEANRSQRLSSMMAAVVSFTYSWMALETMLGMLPLPKVPKKLKSGAKLIDRCIYYLKLSLPGPYDESLLPGYEVSLERFKEHTLKIPRYHRQLGQFCLQPHMNRWGLGLDKVRNIRNRFIHGALQMPGYGDPRMEDSDDDLLFELSGRIVVLTMQLVLYAQATERNILLAGSFNEHKEGESAAEAVRMLHIDNSEAVLTCR